MSGCRWRQLAGCQYQKLWVVAALDRDRVRIFLSLLVFEHCTRMMVLIARTNRWIICLKLWGDSEPMGEVQSTNCQFNKFVLQILYLQPKHYGKFFSRNFFHFSKPSEKSMQSMPIAESPHYVLYDVWVMAPPLMFENIINIDVNRWCQNLWFMHLHFHFCAFFLSSLRSFPKPHAI